MELFHQWGVWLCFCSVDSPLSFRSLLGLMLDHRYVEEVIYIRVGFYVNQISVCVCTCAHICMCICMYMYVSSYSLGMNV